MGERKINGGFSYYLEPEKIKEYLRFSPKERLIWLKEANEFIYKALTPKRRSILEMFRRAEAGISSKYYQINRVKNGVE